MSVSWWKEGIKMRLRNREKRGSSSSAAALKNEILLQEHRRELISFVYQPTAKCASSFKRNPELRLIEMNNLTLK